MKFKPAHTILIVAALCATLPATAQNRTADTSARDSDEFRNGQYELGRSEKASRIIGMEIKDSKGHKIGEVKELAVDLQNARVLEVIVGSGGVVGINEHFRAVPPASLAFDPERKVLRLNVDKARFKSAPRFKTSDWKSNVQDARVNEVYEYYHAKPYYHSLPHPGDIRRASDCIGAGARNQQDEKLGRIENLLVDLPASRVVEVIVASGRFLGIDDELSAVPPQAFRAGTPRDILVVDTPRLVFMRGPHFKPSDWPDFTNPDRVASFYRAYNVEPWFSTDAGDNTAQNVRDRADSAVTPLSEGNSSADLDITSRIRKNVLADQSLSVDAHNIEIITVDGHVTLRGPVKSEDEKHRLETLAADVATKANVDDQLQVAPPQLPIQQNNNNQPK